ncbi:DUF2782 domain-containing protein [Luteimonas sp. 8-5]|uniref:DUF2782 domain-containing protein n=1 Tax=Luteimonas sp. 8-5 TaxID=3039387 RepID=UPI0024371683|nr:DUF2782 domain-containing protein [Luteimonas sp. 8-5]MDG6348939.1 DUF2782 domain-containing protein [Luteimonas sp. 8-5]
MRNPMISALAVALAALLGACASSGEALPVPQTADGVPLVPEDAIEAVVVQDNGDVVHEYRVQGQLVMLKVVPARGPTYYLVDRNGDGRVSPEDGEAPAVYYKLFSW